jgi:hypothetical protein
MSRLTQKFARSLNPMFNDIACLINSIASSSLLEIYFNKKEFIIDNNNHKKGI